MQILFAFFADREGPHLWGIFSKIEGNELALLRSAKKTAHG